MALATLRVEGLQAFPSWEQARQGSWSVSPSEDSADVGEGMHRCQYHMSNTLEHYVLQQHIAPASKMSWQRPICSGERGRSCKVIASNLTSRGVADKSETILWSIVSHRRSRRRPVPC